MMSWCVSDQWKYGPKHAQTTMTPAASTKAAGLPVARAVHLAKRVNSEVDFDGLTTFPPKVLKS